MAKNSFENQPVVGVIMGSESDLTVMQHASRTLDKFDVRHEVRVISAHRTPEKMVKYGKEAVARGLEVIIAGAGGSAHLPGEVASHTHIPVLGVAIGSSPHTIENAVGSMIEMPEGVPLAFMGINKKGAVNAALQSVRMLEVGGRGYAEEYDKFVADMAARVEEIDEDLRTKGMATFLRNQRLADIDQQAG